MAANPAAVAAAGPSSSGAALPPPQNFFPGARLANLFVRDPPELAGEQQLVQELRQRLGCHADEGRLLYQVRSSRGKMHWAGETHGRAGARCHMVGRHWAAPQAAARSSRTWGVLAFTAHPTAAPCR